MAATVVVSLLLLAVGVIRLGLAELQPNEVEASLAEGAENTTSLERAARRRRRLAGTERAGRPAPTGTTQPPPTGSVAGRDDRADDHHVDHHDDDHDAAVGTGRLPRRSATR